MLKKKTGLLFIVLLSFCNSFSTHISGGDLSYEYISGKKYKVYLTIYRDCRGMSLNAQLTLSCFNSSNSTQLKLRRVDRKDLTQLCNSKKPPCHPLGRKSLSGKEKLVYEAEIDFDSAKYASYYNCKKVAIYGNFMSRTNSSNSSSGLYYTQIEIDLEKLPKNSSPKFSKDPKFFHCANMGSFLNFKATDKDGDSLSYSLANPLASSGFYNSPFTAKRPFTFYDPLRNGKEFPFLKPPIGIFLNSKTGMLIFTPTKSGESTFVNIEVTEWRKDSLGVYQEIGKINREVYFEVGNCQLNNNPEIAITRKHTLCAGELFKLKISTKDKVVIPPPPLPSPQKDSVFLTWDMNIPGAKIKLINDTNIQESAIFSWTPDSSQISSKPYSFYVFAMDNFCPRPGSVAIKMEFTVQEMVKGAFKTRKLDCGIYEVSSSYDTSKGLVPSIEWNVFDGNGNRMINDSIVRFINSKTFHSKNRLDTIQFYKKGKYYIQLNTTYNGCTHKVIDSIISDEKVELFKKIKKAVCINSYFQLQVDSIHFGKFMDYSWSFNGKLLKDSFFKSQLINGSGYVFLSARTFNGCTFSDSILIQAVSPPKVKDLHDTAYCTQFDFLFQAVDLNNATEEYNNYLWSDSSMNDTLRVVSGDKYWVQTSNFCGVSSDTFSLNKDEIFNFELGGDKLLCDVKNVEIGLEGKKKGVSYKWNTGENTSLLMVTQSKLYKLKATNSCGVSEDSILVELSQKPKLTWPLEMSYCKVIDDTLDALNEGIGVTYLWMDSLRTKTHPVTSEGIYSVYLHVKHCPVVIAQTEVVRYQNTFSKLGNDTSMAWPFILSLDVGHQKADILWNTLDTTNKISASYYGTYKVRISNVCDTTKDIIRITKILSLNTDLERSINIFPNPNNGAFSVVGSTNNIVSIKMFDRLGLEVPITITQRKGWLDINTNRIRRGLHILQINTSQSSINYKLLIE